jgi:DNA processing protein
MMNTPDRRALLLLCFPARSGGRESAAPLSMAEWRQIGSRLRAAGLSSPGELLEVRPQFWAATGLADAEIARVRALLERGAALDEELQRLAERELRVVTSADLEYPTHLRLRLRGSAPPVLFAAGDWSLLDQPALAIVGSRDVDAEGEAFTRGVAERCVRDGLAVITGGARGVDQLAMRAALEAGGAVVGVAAGDLEKTVRTPDTQNWLAVGQLLLLSPFHPRTSFTVGNAMSRNKVVYALAKYGLVVSSAHGHGGTWAGASEVRRHGWVPLFVRDGAVIPDGNRELLRPAAIAFPSLERIGDEPLPAWLARRSAASASDAPVSWPASGPEAGDDLLPVVWPRLAGYLTVPRSLPEITEAFHLTPSQVRAWLQRAEVEGCVSRIAGPPRRYQAVLQPPLQARLFEGSVEHEADGFPESVPPGRDSD